MRPITIAGGGLAGLVLGNTLARAGVPTTLHEAGRLPRHRVCGEFICGHGTRLLRSLDLDEALCGALEHRSTRWYYRERPVLKVSLPEPACGISRHRLDQALLRMFQSRGGRYKERSRVRLDANPEGTVDCTGRPVTKSPWLGLKLHGLDLKTAADLELHLGNRAYVGLSRVEDGRTNICGLFSKRPGLRANREDLLVRYLDECGLRTLSERIRSAQIDPASHAAVAGVAFGRPSMQASGGPRLGDALGVIPPFTGNGMSIAIESAALAAEPLHDYARGNLDWNTATGLCARRCSEAFRGRLRIAGKLHPWLTRPAGQKLIAGLARGGILPFRVLYSLTH